MNHLPPGGCRESRGDVARPRIVRSIGRLAMGMHIACAIAFGFRPVWAVELSVPFGRTFAAQDTLARSDEAETEDARECLAGLYWNPGEFTVRCEKPQGGPGDALVRFPSPIDTGSAANDEVALEWHVARDADGNPLRAPAIVVVHESGRAMPVGRLIAGMLRLQQLHAFMIQLPGYGVRRSTEEPEAKSAIAIMRQAVADVRRARDAVAALPLVDSRVIGLQGTSLGGFVTATVAGLDRGYQRTFILLAGGNLHEVIERGQRDASALRERLKAAGIEGSQVRDLTRPVEPLRLAHRVDPHTTWLYSGRFDDVVPPACSHAFARAAQLPKSHHIELPADHYNGIVLLPTIIREIRQAMEVAEPPPAADSDAPPHAPNGS